MTNLEDAALLRTKLRPELPRRSILVSAVALIPLGVVTIGLASALFINADQVLIGRPALYSGAGIWSGIAAIGTAVAAILAQQKANEARLLVLSAVSSVGLASCCAAIAVSFVSLDSCDYNGELLPRCDWTVPLNATNAALLVLEVPFYAIVIIAALKYYCCPPASSYFSNMQFLSGSRRHSFHA